MAGYLIPAPSDPAERAAWEAAVARRYPPAPPERHHRDVVTYLDMAQIGSWFGVSAGTVSKWRTRYAQEDPCPEPDALTGQTPGWLPAREPEWRAWKGRRAGQGAKGRPKPRRQAE